MFKSLLRWIDLMQRTTVLNSWSVQFYIILSTYGKTVARQLLRCHHAMMAASLCRDLGITRMWLSCDCVSISHRSLHESLAVFVFYLVGAAALGHSVGRAS